MAQKAGKIYGSALCGLCERACIEAKRIFDGCMSRRSAAAFTVRLNGFTAGTAAPFTFVSAASDGFSTVSDEVITAVGGGRSRVSFTVTAPITVSYTDAAGTAGSASGTVTFSREVNFSLPDSGAYPYEIEAATSLFSSTGQFLSDDTVTFSACVLQIVRVTAVVELLVPTYGYCEYPACDDPEGDCPGIAGMPRFAVTGGRT